MQLAKWLVKCLLVGSLAVLGACANGAEQTGQSDDHPAQQSVNKQTKETPHEPVTITYGLNLAYLTQEDFQRYVADPVKRKYPYITVESVLLAKGVTIPSLIASGNTPDLIVTPTPDMTPLINLNLINPLDGLMKKYNMDANQFLPVSLDTIKLSTETDKIVALPIQMQFSALYYNKDIFDKFGAAYPKDGMTWDEARDLAVKVTRTDAGVQYRGLEPNTIVRPSSQLSLAYIDSKTNKALVESNDWKKVVNMMKNIYDIPGNQPKNMAIGAYNVEFAKDRTLAMLASNNIFYEAGLDKVPDLNWDMTTYPTFPEAPRAGIQFAGHAISISPTSKHQDEAFLVIQTYVSDEVQLEMSRNGIVSARQGKQFPDAFATAVPFLKGKNIPAAFKTDPAKPFIPTRYNNHGRDAMNAAMQQIVLKGKDVNTALREASETIDKQIAEDKASDK